MISSPSSGAASLPHPDTIAFLPFIFVGVSQELLANVMFFEWNAQ